MVKSLAVREVIEVVFAFICNILIERKINLIKYIEHITHRYKI